jgi:integrase
MSTALRLHTREARKKLAPRDAPYYHELRRGLHLGYRRGTDGGSWLLREFRNGRYVKRRLGAADDATPSDGIAVLDWQEAQQQALGTDRPTVTKPTKYTVAEAAEAYFNTRSGTTQHDRYTYDRHIAPKLGGEPINDLTTGVLEKWLHGLIPSTDDREKRRKAQASANRYWNVLNAILNSAFRKDSARVPSDAAWRRVRSFPKADQPRTRTLTADEAQRLLAKLPQPLRDRARGALNSGLRFSELGRLTAFDITKNSVHVRNAKGDKSRTVPLNREGAAFFASMAKGLAHDAPLFDYISSSYASRVIRKACTAAKIAPHATFHDLRRSYGSLLLNAGTSADAIQELLGHADLRMTRRTYAHMAGATLHKAVLNLPSFTAAKKRKRR